MHIYIIAFTFLYVLSWIVLAMHSYSLCACYVPTALKIEQCLLSHGQFEDSTAHLNAICLPTTAAHRVGVFEELGCLRPWCQRILSETRTDQRGKVHGILCFVCLGLKTGPDPLTPTLRVQVTHWKASATYSGDYVQGNDPCRTFAV